MTQNAHWIVIVTYQEWLTWAACGALRIGEKRRTRLKKGNHKLSHDEFGELMD